MKFYIYQDKNGDLFLVGGSGIDPKEMLCEAPGDYPVEALDIEDEIFEDDEGVQQTRKVAKLNQVKLDAYLAKQASDKAASEQAESERQARRKAAYDKLVSADLGAVNSIASLKALVKELIELIKE